jgi:hypothetical protein
VKVITTTGTAQASNNVNAWAIGGPILFDVGAGARLLVSPRSALTAGVKLQAGVGGPATLFGFAPEVGFQIGF